MRLFVTSMRSKPGGAYRHCIDFMQLIRDQQGRDQMSIPSSRGWSKPVVKIVILIVVLVYTAFMSILGYDGMASIGVLLAAAAAASEIHRRFSSPPDASPVATP